MVISLMAVKNVNVGQALNYSIHIIERYSKTVFGSPAWIQTCNLTLYSLPPYEMT